jgi:uncharacterized membrane protein AbrB (regulator of aidB expression)
MAYKVIQFSRCPLTSIRELSNAFRAKPTLAINILPLLCEIMATTQNVQHHHHHHHPQDHHNKRALISLGLICLATGIWSAFLTLPKSNLNYLTCVLGALVISPLLSIGLEKWIYHSRHVSDVACNSSLIGGLITANIVSPERRPFFLEHNVQYVLWPAHIGMFVGYFWE